MKKDFFLWLFFIIVCCNLQTSYAVKYTSYIYSNIQIKRALRENNPDILRLLQKRILPISADSLLLLSQPNNKKMFDVLLEQPICISRTQLTKFARQIKSQTILHQIVCRSENLPTIKHFGKNWYIAHMSFQFHQEFMFNFLISKKNFESIYKNQYDLSFPTKGTFELWNSKQSKQEQLNQPEDTFDTTTEEQNARSYSQKQNCGALILLLFRAIALGDVNFINHVCFNSTLLNNQIHLQKGWLKNAEYFLFNQLTTQHDLTPTKTLLTRALQIAIANVQTESVKALIFNQNTLTKSHLGHKEVWAVIMNELDFLKSILNKLPTDDPKRGLYSAMHLELMRVIYSIRSIRRSLSKAKFPNELIVKIFNYYPSITEKW